MKYKHVKREEELKGKVGADWFDSYDDTRILGNVDFCVSPKTKSTNFNIDIESLLWAEAKTGDFDVFSMFSQLIITIGKERTFDKYLPPAFLGAFDFKKIVFIPYNSVIDIFFKNDFNWSVAPSNHETKEFKIIKKRVQEILKTETYMFDFLEDEKELKFFIKNNIASASEGGKILIDKNNFVPIYLRWLTQVKPYINFDWAEGKKQNIFDSDFYLADLFVDDHGTSSIDDDTPLKEELFVVFKRSHYEIAKKNLKSLFDASIQIKNKTKYEDFWKKYKRSPILGFHDFIIERRDLLIPQDIRERKGAFFTPQIWVERSQEYITHVLGKNWQDEYYIWDCAAGTGNLLAGLTNKYNVWASTIDMADVDVMYDRISNGVNLLEENVFQFDFLNDDFKKLPKGLKQILQDSEKRKKLIIYINPPYAEHLDIKNTLNSTDNINKAGLKFTKIDKLYKDKYGSKASRELFVQFFIRIYEEIPDSIIAGFSKLKYLNSSNFIQFRKVFKANYKSGFMCPANTFDNVTGNFPIGFLIWNTSKKMDISSLSLDVLSKDGDTIGKKLIYIPTAKKGSISMNDWIKKFDFSNSKYSIGNLNCSSQDFLHQNYTGITINKQNSAYKQLTINELNIKEVSVYFAVTFCFEASWINDRDQFLYPKNEYSKDVNFINDCLVFSIFHSQNRISSNEGINHWIPFTEKEINAKSKFESNFLSQYINGKLKIEHQLDLFGTKKHNNQALIFTKEATSVLDSGKKLWKYYHKQRNVNSNASLYDIREYFQGRGPSGKMNNKSEDETYMEIINDLRNNLKVLAENIAPKIYKYGYLIK